MAAMDEYENSGITSHKDAAKRFTLRQDPSTVTVMDSANIGGGVETGSTGERDMHSDATSEKHATPPVVSDVAKQQEDSIRSASGPASSGSGRESALSPPNDDVGDGHSHGGLPGAGSSPSSQHQQESTSGHASDFQSAEGLESDMPDRKGVHPPDSSGDRATDITGIPYIQ